MLAGENITISAIVSIAKNRKEPGLTAATLHKIAKGRAILEAMVKQDTPNLWCNHRVWRNGLHNR